MLQTSPSTNFRGPSLPSLPPFHHPISCGKSRKACRHRPRPSQAPIATCRSLALPRSKDCKDRHHCVARDKAMLDMVRLVSSNLAMAFLHPPISKKQDWPQKKHQGDSQTVGTLLHVQDACWNMLECSILSILNIRAQSIDRPLKAGA